MNLGATFVNFPSQGVYCQLDHSAQFLLHHQASVASSYSRHPSSSSNTSFNGNVSCLCNLMSFLNRAYTFFPFLLWGLCAVNLDRRLPLVDSFLGIGVAFGRCLFWAELVPRKRKQTKSNVSGLVKRVPALPLVSVDSVKSSLRDCRSSISSLKCVATTRTAASRALHRVLDSLFTVHLSFSAIFFHRPVDPEKKYVLLLLHFPEKGYDGRVNRSSMNSCEILGVVVTIDEFRFGFLVKQLCLYSADMTGHNCCIVVHLSTTVKKIHVTFIECFNYGFLSSSTLLVQLSEVDEYFPNSHVARLVVQVNISDHFW